MKSCQLPDNVARIENVELPHQPHNVAPLHNQELPQHLDYVAPIEGEFNKLTQGKDGACFTCLNRRRFFGAEISMKMFYLSTIIYYYYYYLLI